MSAPERNVFARWSHLKRAAKNIEERRDAAPRSEDSTAPVVAETAAFADLQEPAEPDPAEPEALASLEPLPRLEDLSAEGDLSAFMRTDVPEALKSAALRQMWSLDPAIRDHIGLAEYAWDFNQPASMAGFGPLNAPRTLVDFLSRVGEGAQTDLEEEVLQPSSLPSAASIDSSPENASATASSGNGPADRPPGRQDDAVSSSALPSQTQSPRPRSETGVHPHPSEEEAATIPRHGGAMPR